MTEKEKMLRNALDIFLNYPDDEASQDSKNTFQNSSLPADEQLEQFSEFPQVSYFRGSEIDKSCKIHKKYFSKDSSFNCDEFMINHGGSFKSVELDDTEFFDSDARKQIILNQKEFSLMNNNKDCTECGAWTLSSHKRLSKISSSTALSKLPYKSSVNISEFIGAKSEPLGSVCFNLPEGMSFSDCTTSTPLKRQSVLLSPIANAEINDFGCFKLNTVGKYGYADPIFSFSPDPAKEKNENFDILPYYNISSKLNFDENKYRAFQESPLLKHPHWFSPQTKTSRSILDELSHYIGQTPYKNLQRLREEERMMMNKKSSKGPLESLEADKTFECKLGFDSKDTESLESTLKLLAVKEDENIDERWSVRPQEVILNSIEGKRVLLTNNSQTNLKFKTKYNGKITNICPLSGTVPSMGQVGIRILLSHYLKKCTRNAEDDVKIVIGKTEKNIHVKVIKQQRPKSTKERAYMLF